MILGIYGKPRAGKTTLAARMARKNYIKLRICNKLPFLRRLLHSYDVIYCTDETIAHTVHISYDNLGKWRPPRNSLIILEEAGIGLDNRNYKKLDAAAARLFALHGHIGCDIIWSSQTADVDKKLRNRTHKLLLVEKSWMPGFSRVIPVAYAVDVDDDTHKLDDMYSRPRGFLILLYALIGRVKYVFRPFWYRYFDSFVDNGVYPLDGPC